jgi:hypothetical protein
VRVYPQASGGALAPTLTVVGEELLEAEAEAEAA